MVDEDMDYGVLIAYLLFMGSHLQFIVHFSLEFSFPIHSLDFSFYVFCSQLSELASFYRSSLFLRSKEFLMLRFLMLLLVSILFALWVVSEKAKENLKSLSLGTSCPAVFLAVWFSVHHSLRFFALGAIGIAIMAAVFNNEITTHANDFVSQNLK